MATAKDMPTASDEWLYLASVFINIQNLWTSQKHGATCDFMWMYPRWAPQTAVSVQIGGPERISDFSYASIQDKLKKYEDVFVQRNVEVSKEKSKNKVK